MTALIVLPGLDGTATLHAAFAEAAGRGFESVAVIPYPADKLQDYSGIESLVRSLLPTETPFVLLGESFSGPVAISIAAAPPANLLGLVLSTTFAAPPLPMPALVAALAPLAPVRAWPSLLVSWYLLGRWSTPQMMESLQRALLGVPSRVLRHRVASTLRADVSGRLGDIRVPVLCLRATGDRLLSRNRAVRMAAAIPDCVAIDVEGPHLLLQAAPSDCARAVCDFAGRLGQGCRFNHPSDQAQPGFPVTAGAFIR